MLVRVLGAVELVASGGTAVSLPGARQPALLAALAARANEVVSTDRLVDLLWGDDLPANPEASLHSAVFKLRGNLRAAGGREVLLTRDHGYQLALLPGDLDAERFTGLVREARDQPPEQAAATLVQALGLWRGSAYAGFADTEVAHLAALGLEEARRTAVERLGQALLACGRAGEVIPVLEPFVAEHPPAPGHRWSCCSAGSRASTSSRPGATPGPRCWSVSPARSPSPCTTGPGPASPPAPWPTTGWRPASRSWPRSSGPSAHRCHCWPCRRPARSRSRSRHAGPAG